MTNIIKATGEKELFSEEKLRRSIQRAGIPQDMQEKVVAHIHEKLHEGIPTSEIYHHITEFLHHSPYPFAKAKYSLKQSLMDLGPTGYPFEDFVADILKAEGYDTTVRVVLQGLCVTHEIDVIAKKDKEIIMVEAKFHNQLGTKTAIHVALYTKARFDDVKAKNNLTNAWLITNTKTTIESISYGLCSGMKIISWSYPETDSLRDLIEKHSLFPVTALTTLSLQQKQVLLNNHIVLCKDICADYNKLNILQLTPDQQKQVHNEASFVCSK